MQEDHPTAQPASRYGRAQYPAAARSTRRRRRTAGRVAIAVAVILLLAAVGVGLWWARSQPQVPSASFKAGTGTLVVQTAHGRADVRGSETVQLSVSGGDFSRANAVTFELLNTSDPKATALQLKAARANGAWTASFDPAVSGVGDYDIATRATLDDGTSTVSHATYMCTATFLPATGTVVVGGGDYDVAYGMAGLKVKRIQDVLGNGNDNYPRYLDHTQDSIAQFQTQRGLPSTGVVDQATWLALGLDPVEWFSVGAYVSPSAVGAHASTHERVEAMIARAADYLGDPYVWDAAGEPGQGVDCAGLVMQALYAAGYDLGIVNPVTHSTTSWGDQDAVNLYAYCNLTQVDPAHMQRGDLVFYGEHGKVDHVAIYLGNNQIIEAHTSGVRITDATYRPVMGARRVFG